MIRWAMFIAAIIGVSLIFYIAIESYIYEMTP